MSRLRLWGLALIGALCLMVAAQAQDLQPVPRLTARVMDLTATLSDAQRAALEHRLEAFEQDKGSQIVVLVVATTAPEDIAAYANRVADSWKIGRKDVGDGLLLLVARDDRKVRIEVARALEGAVPDLAAKRVIDRAITPHFRQGDFAGGLQAGVDELMALVRQEPLPAVQDAPAPPGTPSGLLKNVGMGLLGTLVLFAPFGLAAGVGTAILLNGLASLFLILRAWQTHSWQGATDGYLGGLVLSFAFLVVVGIVAGIYQKIFGESVAPRKTSDSSDTDSSTDSDSSSGFSSGGGGSFGGGGASGEW